MMLLPDNRLITSIVLNNDERRAVARAHSDQMAKATSATALLMSLKGCGEWDREGEDLNDPEGLAAFMDELRQTCPDNVEKTEPDCHINNEAFAKAALNIFDDWVAKGIVPKAI